MNVLICEDEALLLTALEFRLSKQGFKLVKAHTAKEAMDALASQHIDVLVTDIQLPDVSGMEVIKSAKFHNSATPVIVMSALGQEETIFEAFQLGANDFVVKPFRPAELLVRIQKCLDEVEVEAGLS